MLTALLASVGGASAYGRGKEPPRSEHGWYVNFDLVKRGDFLGTRHPSYTRDRFGTTHFTFSGDHGVQYKSRSAGSRRWYHTVVPGTRKWSGDDLSSKLATSPNGKTVFLAVQRCGIYVVAKSRHRKNFPPVGSGKPMTTGCGESGDVSNWELHDIVGIGHGRVAVLLENPGNDFGQPGIYVYFGKPDGPWHQTLVSTSTGGDNARQLRIARDLNTHMLVEAGPGPLVATKQPGEPWSAQQRLALQSLKVGGDDLDVSGLAAMHGQAWLLLQRTGRIRYLPTDHLHNPVANNDGVFLSQRSRSGQWSQPARLPGTDKYAIEGRLLADAKRHRVHALFSNANDKAATTAGIYHLADAAGRWSKPHRLTQSWEDTPFNMTLTKAGDYKYAFERY